MLATEDIRYPASVHSYAQIGYLSNLLKAYGVNSIDPTKARVIEIGCAYGTNLLAMAESYPKAQFIGFDIDPKAIAEAKAVAVEANIDNVEFIVGDDLPAAFKSSTFDYILAHGLFSWVPDDVKESILQFCKTKLSHDGIAYINYNCNPGWLHTSAINELFTLEIENSRGINSLSPFLDRLSLFKDALPKANHKNPSAAYLREVVESIEAKNEAVLAGEILSESNDPFYISEFCQWLDEYQLEYLGDANPAQHLLINLSEAEQILLNKYTGNPIMQHQVMDFLENRRFRSSLFRKRKSATQITVENGLAAISYKLASPLKQLQRKGDMIRLVLKDNNAINAPSFTSSFFSQFESSNLAVARESYSGFTDKQKATFEHLILTLVQSHFLIPACSSERWVPICSQQPKISLLNRVFHQKYGFVYNANKKSVRPSNINCLQLMNGTNTTGEIAEQINSPEQSVREVIEILNHHQIM